MLHLDSGRAQAHQSSLHADVRAGEPAPDTITFQERMSGPSTL